MKTNDEKLPGIVAHRDHGWFRLNAAMHSLKYQTGIGQMPCHKCGKAHAGYTCEDVK